MLYHTDRSDWLICKLHGTNCANEKDGNHSFRPVDTFLNDVTLSTTTEYLIELSKSTCLILNIFSRIAVLRRSKSDLTIVQDFVGFKQVLRQNIWYFLNMAHARILVSILETFADNSESAAAATAATILIRTERMARMVSYKKKDLHKIKNEMRRTCVTAPDTVINTFKRLRSTLYWHPLVWLVFYQILKFDMESEDHTFHRCDNLKYYEIYDFPFSTVSDYVREFLQPSTINSKYQKLYLDQHRLNAYGGATRFPKRDIDFLLNNRCLDLLDFGCGQGNRNHKPFEWHRYDPCFLNHNTIPDRSFSGVISYDVLEHIPEDELVVTCRWLEIFAEKCIVLGIACCSAPSQERGLLINGENSHCTVKPPYWWLDKLREFLPEFDVLNSFQSDDYVTVHLKRSPRHDSSNSL